MRYIDLQIAFETEINEINNSFEKPLTVDTEYFLNLGLDKFWKTRYSGMNYKLLSFELTEKRTDDLRTLVTSSSFIPTKVDNETYKVLIPENYIILLGDRAGILPIDNDAAKCWKKDENNILIPTFSDTLEATLDTVDRIKENSLSEYHLKYSKARPIRLIQGDDIYLYTDGKYKASIYNLQYLRKPIRIDIHTNPFMKYTDMPDHTQIEIVKLAAQMYIENKGNQRYQSYNNEVNTME